MREGEGRLVKWGIVCEWNFDAESKDTTRDRAGTYRNTLYEPKARALIRPDPISGATVYKIQF